MSATKKNMAKIPLTLRVVSLYIVAGAMVWGVGPLQPSPDKVSPVATAQPVAVTPKLVQAKKVISGKPIHLSIERLAIDLTIKDGFYDSSTKGWTLSDDAAYFAAMTDQPNDNRGNTFIYGHNIDQVLARTKDILPGDVLIVTTANGHTFHYTYTGDGIVTPDQTQVLNDKPDKPRVTLMTCEGVWSETRRIMYFDFKEVI